MYLIFDTETTGLPKDWKAPISQVDNWPRIIQLAWGLYTPKGQKIVERETLIRPDGWEVPDTPFHKENGFTTNKCEAVGRSIDEVVKEFMEHLMGCPWIIAHNMAFDRAVMGAEMIRLGTKPNPGPKPDPLCTMRGTADLVRIPDPYGKKLWKWPKLIELHQFLFNKGFSGAHDALADVRACKRCFFELIHNQGVEVESLKFQDT